MKLKIGDWYVLANTMHPENRSMDRKVVITGLDRKSVYFDQKAGPGMPPTASFSMSRANFRRHVLGVVVKDRKKQYLVANKEVQRSPACL